MTVRNDYTFLNTHTHTGYSKIDLAYLHKHTQGTVRLTLHTYTNTEYSKVGKDLSRRF